jgi:MinD-like ATPase involved in chromosome partitioning or flagellar assembly
LVIDTDVERQSLSSVTRVRGTPGLLDVLAGRVEWAAAVRSVVVDRDRTLDVLPSGAFGAHEGLDSMITDVAQLLEHVGRRYDCVLLSAPLSSGGGLSLTATLGSPVLVVRRARTPVRSLVGLTGLIRDRGCQIRGALMWCRGEPIAVSA